MYLKLHISNRDVKEHLTGGVIPKRVPYIRICNGTIGPGARHINVSVDHILELLTNANEVMTWSERQKAYAIKAAESYEQVDVGFCADDIPF